MTKRMYLGLATLIILLGIIGFLLFIGKQDTDPRFVSKAPSQDVLDNLKNQQNVPKTPIHEAAHDPSPDTPSKQTPKKVKYATEPLGYTKAGVEGMYLTHIPRDPDRFSHLPPPPLPPSSVPDDIPEHLKLKPEWIDGVYRGIEPNPPDDQLTDDIRRSMGEIILEIVRDHNPKRPYAQIWDRFIEYEKMYRAYAEYELGYTPSASMAFNRIDWIYEQVWAFPEFAELGMSTRPPPSPGEENRFHDARNIALGISTPSWNKFTLEDGRDFFIKGETRYEFMYKGITEAGEPWERVSGFSRTRVTESTPVVRIDVLNTSDEDLQALMGGDYSINPLTMQPMDHDSSYVTLIPRF